MTTRTTLGGLALAATLLFTSSLPAQDKAEDAKKKQAEMMALYAKAATPGPQHKLLEPMIGKWTFTAKFWMDPSQPAMDVKGVAERKWVLGGRFVTDDVESPGFEGSTFQGFGLMGFDNLQQKYTSLWADFMRTGFVTAIGTVDSAGKVFTYHKEEIDPLTKLKLKARDVVKIESNDKHSMEMYKMLPDGKEMKVGEIHYTRKK